MAKLEPVWCVHGQVRGDWVDGEIGDWLGWHATQSGNPWSTIRSDIKVLCGCYVTPSPQCEGNVQFSASVKREPDCPVCLGVVYRKQLRMQQESAQAQLVF